MYIHLQNLLQSYDAYLKRRSNSGHLFQDRPGSYDVACRGYTIYVCDRDHGCHLHVHRYMRRRSLIHASIFDFFFFRYDTVFSTPIFKNHFAKIVRLSQVSTVSVKPRTLRFTTACSRCQYVSATIYPWRTPYSLRINYQYLSLRGAMNAYLTRTLHTN